MPDLSAVAGVPKIYWIITGDVITEMNQTEKDAVDAQILSDRRDSVADELDDLEVLTRQIVISTIREINILRDWIAEFKVQVAAAGNLGNLQTRVAGLPDLSADRTIAQFKSQVRSDLGT